MICPGPIVRGRHLHDVRPHETEPRQAPHQAERLIGGETTDLGSPRGRRERRIHGIDVEGAVDRPAAEPLQAGGDPVDAALLDDFDPDGLDPVGVVEGEVLRPVQWPPKADLNEAPGVHDPFLHRPPEGRPVEELVAEVLVPRVGMGVEVDDAERTVAPGERAQDGQGHRVIAADAQRHGPRGAHLVDPPADRGIGVLDGDRDHVHVAAVRHAQALEGVDLEDGMPGPDQRGLLAHRPRPEPGAGAVRGAPVVRNAEERDVQARRRWRRRKEHEGGDLAEPGRGEGIARAPLAHRLMLSAPDDPSDTALRGPTADPRRPSRGRRSPRGSCRRKSWRARSPRRPTPA